MEWNWSFLYNYHFLCSEFAKRAKPWSSSSWGNGCGQASLVSEWEKRLQYRVRACGLRFVLEAQTWRQIIIKKIRRRGFDSFRNPSCFRIWVVPEQKILSQGVSLFISPHVFFGSSRRTANVWKLRFFESDLRFGGRKGKPLALSISN